MKSIDDLMPAEMENEEDRDRKTDQRSDDQAELHDSAAR
jgi:hypothetical protein